MKKTVLIFLALGALFTITSCKKQTCYVCVGAQYGQLSSGEWCDDLSESALSVMKATCESNTGGTWVEKE